MAEDFFEFDLETVDEAEGLLGEMLKRLLVLLYLREIDEYMCIWLGLEALQEEYSRILGRINVAVSGRGFATVPEILFRRRLDRVKEDWVRVVRDVEVPLQPEEADPKLLTRAGLVSWYLVFNMFGDAVRQVAVVEGFNFIEWITRRDTSVCEVCLENEGMYHIFELPLYPAHIAGRCRLRLWRILVENLSLTRRIHVGNLYSVL